MDKTEGKRLFALLREQLQGRITYQECLAAMKPQQPVFEVREVFSSARSERPGELVF